MARNLGELYESGYYSPDELDPEINAAKLKLAMSEARPNVQQVSPGSELEKAAQSQEMPTGFTPEERKAMAKTASSSMSAGGSPGQILTGTGASVLAQGLASDAGLSTAAGVTGGGALAAGLALSFHEQQRQADAAQEQARIKEAEDRKLATQNAINSMINVTRGLGVS